MTIRPAVWTRRRTSARTPSRGLRPAALPLEPRALMTTDLHALGTPRFTATIAGPGAEVAGFNAPAGGSYTATIAWGDGTAGAAVVSPHAAVPGGEYYDVTAPPHAYAQAGDEQATVTVTAADGTAQSVAVPIVVVPLPGAPTDVTPDAVSGYAGVPLTESVVRFLGSYAWGTQYRAAIDWGDGSPATTAAPELIAIPQIVPGGPTGPVPNAGFQGTHTYARAGQYTLAIDIVAPDGTSTWTSTVASVAAAPTGPVGLAPTATSTIQNAPLPHATIATFSGDPRLAYAARVDWGDGSAPTPADVAPRGAGSSLPDFAVRGSHTYAKACTYTTAIEVIASTGQVAWTSSTVTVEPGNLSLQGDASPLAATQGTALNGATLASFLYRYLGQPPAAGDYAATVDWGDGSAPAFAKVVLGTPPPTAYGIFMEAGTVVGSHTYLTPGSYPVHIHMYAPDGENLGVASTVVVAADPTGPSALAPVATSGTQEVPMPGSLLATFQLPAGDKDAYVATADWGDGSTPSFATIVPMPTPQVVGPGGTPMKVWGVVGTHEYLAPGTYLVRVNLIRQGGESDWVWTTAAIAADADPATNLHPIPAAGTAGRPLTEALLATFHVPDLSGYVATINWGDGTAPTFGSVDPYSAATTIVYPGMPNAGATGAHIYAKAGTYPITVNLLGPRGESLWVATSATIAAAKVG